MSVSYTHLDVYKRQVLFPTLTSSWLTPPHRLSRMTNFTAVYHPRILAYLSFIAKVLLIVVRSIHLLFLFTMCPASYP